MKKIISLILVLTMVFSLSGCIDDIEQIFNSSTDSSSGNYSNYSSYGESSYFENGSNTSIPTFYSLNDLRDYLNVQKDNNKFKISFKYKGKDMIEAQMLAQMTSSCFVWYDGYDDVHTVTLSEYPGDRIVDAYFSNNKSALTADEKKVMEKAIQMVTSAKTKAKSDWELELLLHDMLADSVVYYTDSRVNNIESVDKIPRFITAIGAFLDGKANCQGYSDAFYLLASIAGFTVSRMNVETADDLHVINTILLNGNWYVVDVTFDDQKDDNTKNYRYFNAGMDQMNEYGWKSWKEIHKIALTSGDDFYYNHENLVFDSMDSFVTHIETQWRKGEKTIRGMLKNYSDGHVIKTLIENRFENFGVVYSFKYAFYKDSENLYYTIEFD